MSREKKTLRDPDIKGTHASAWKFDSDQDYWGNCGGWFIECPSAHPIWSHYAISLAHLRDRPGTPPAIIHRPFATHELALMALGYDGDADEIKDETVKLLSYKENKFKRLEPMNFVGQIVEISDELAMAQIEEAVRDICDGKLNPDTDFLSQWTSRFGDHCLVK